MASISGRFVNLMSRRAPGLMHIVTRRQIKQFRASMGAKSGAFRGKPIFVLDVVGRTSGESRPVMLMLVRNDDDLLVCGSYGGNPHSPNWYKNLMAAGKAHVEVGDERWAVDARELDEGPERDESWNMCVAAYPDFAAYQELTERRIPIAVLTRSSE